MGTHYHHLTLEDRCDMARLHADGLSLRQIAATLDRPPSTVAREMKRNRSRTQGYQPRYAEQQARARRWRGAKLDRDAPLRTTCTHPPPTGLDPRASRGPPRPRCRAARPLPRNHLSLYLRSDRPNENLCLAPLFAPSQSHPRPPTHTSQPRRLDGSPPPPRRAPRRSRRPPDPGPLGSRSDALPAPMAKPSSPSTSAPPASSSPYAPRARPPPLSPTP